MRAHPVQSRPNEWVKLRDKIIERDNGNCQGCGQSPRDGRTLVVHHIRPVSLGGTDHEDNLVTLCNQCHYQVHKLATGDRCPPSLLEKDETDESRSDMTPEPLKEYESLPPRQRDVLICVVSADGLSGSQIHDRFKEFGGGGQDSSTYETLGMLRDKGLIESTAVNGRRNAYWGTDLGKEVVYARFERMKQLLDRE